MYHHVIYPYHKSHFKNIHYHTFAAEGMAQQCSACLVHTALGSILSTANSSGDGDGDGGDGGHSDG